MGTGEFNTVGEGRGCNPAIKYFYSSLLFPLEI